MSEESIPQIPDLRGRHYRFIINQGPENLKEDAKQQLLQIVKENEMTPFYRILADENTISLDLDLETELNDKNNAKIKEIEEQIAKAEELEGETDILDGWLAKGEYLAKIADKEGAITAYKVAYDKTGSLGHRLDILFAFIRLGFFYYDNELISKNIEKAKSLFEQGGDWERRNRLKVYEGLYLLSIRNFKDAATLLFDAISTFTCTELMTYEEFIKYTVLTTVISFQRVQMKKVINAPEILEVLNDIPYMDGYLNALHGCNYEEFFRSLAAIEEHHLFTSSFLAPHAKFYVREMRIIGYSQLLESYRSVTIQSVAKSFGVSEEFIDRDISKFVAAGRLHCVIDKVNGVIETNRPDVKYAQYQNAIKQGDILLNRIQKLGRVINI